MRVGAHETAHHKGLDVRAAGGFKARSDGADIIADRPDLAAVGTVIPSGQARDIAQNLPKAVETPGGFAQLTTTEVIDGVSVKRLQEEFIRRNLGNYVEALNAGNAGVGSANTVFAGTSDALFDLAIEGGASLVQKQLSNMNSWDDIVAHLSGTKTMDAARLQGMVEVIFEEWINHAEVMGGADGVSTRLVAVLKKYGVPGFEGYNVDTSLVPKVFFRNKGEIVKINGMLGFADGGLVPGFNRGGLVSGPGGPREDSILARISDGEFIMSNEAVRRIGVQNLEALNRGTLPGFQDGGFVLPEKAAPEPWK